MAKRGPRRKTKEELKGSNTWRAKNAPDEPDRERPQSGKGLLRAPTYLTKEEKKIWRRMLPKAIEMKTYKNADHDSFAQLCRCLNTLLSVQKKLIEDGFTSDVTYQVGDGDKTRTVSVTKESPLFKTEKRCILNYNTFAAQFGFNPLSRTRLQITPYHIPGSDSQMPIDPNPNGPLDPKRQKIFEMMNLKKTS